ncbi:MAG: type III polyketide synthase, partial [Isosphaeraceae bacterium]
MSMLIAGIGTAVPPHRISQVDAAEIAKQYSCETAAQERLFQTLYRRAGVDGRNCVVLNKSDGPLDGRQSFYTSS